MKRLITVILILALLLPAAALADYTSLHDVQQYIYTTSVMAMKDIPVTLTGTIDRIEYANQSNHYDMFILVDEENAAESISEIGPGFIAHIRFRDPYIRLERGQVVTVSGKLNSFYSTFLVPYILVDTIDGSDNF